METITQLEFEQIIQDQKIEIKVIKDMCNDYEQMYNRQKDRVKELEEFINDLKYNANKILFINY
jgi:replicative DNA helicase